MHRIDVTHAETPSFIGGWNLDNPQMCQDLIDFFERNRALQQAGTTIYGVDKSRKDATDIKINPKDLQYPTHACLAAYFRELHRCYLDYLQQWPFFGRMLKEVDIGTFHIQKYDAGGHYASVHSERASAMSIHRVLVWMTYLNTVEDGGHTNFAHFGLDVKPERGKTLIWPAEWTHAHSGKVVNSGSKYIITGWMLFPLIRNSAISEVKDLAAQG